MSGENVEKPLRFSFAKYLARNGENPEIPRKSQKTIKRVGKTNENQWKNMVFPMCVFGILDFVKIMKTRTQKCRSEKTLRL